MGTPSFISLLTVMNAAIDIGNTRVKAGVYSKGISVAIRELQPDQVLEFLEEYKVESLILSAVTDSGTLLENLKEVSGSDPV